MAEFPERIFNLLRIINKVLTKLVQIQIHLYLTALGLILPSHRSQKRELTGTRIPVTQMVERRGGGLPEVWSSVLWFSFSSYVKLVLLHAEILL